MIANSSNIMNKSNQNHHHPKVYFIGGVKLFVLIISAVATTYYNGHKILVCEGFSVSSSSQKMIWNNHFPSYLLDRNVHDKSHGGNRLGSTVIYANHKNRRDMIGNVLIVGCSLLRNSDVVDAASIEVLDDSSMNGNGKYMNGSFESFMSNASKQQQQEEERREVDDEITVEVKKEDLLKTAGLGIELGEVEFRTNRRVIVKSVEPNSLASQLGIQKDWVVVRVNGQTAERTNTEGVAIMVSRAARSNNNDSTISLTFRDPSVFRKQLQSLNDSDSKSVTTQVAPMGDTTQRNEKDGSVKLGYEVTEQSDQRLTVSQLIAPKLCTRGATLDDLLEISYLGTVVETGQVFDGSTVKINGQAIPGRADDVSLYFVLGKQPFGQFPPSWDVGLEGMCVGERRRLVIPPVLAYGSKGLPRRNIPPNATLQYDITLLSLNGLATPQ